MITSRLSSRFVALIGALVLSFGAVAASSSIALAQRIGQPGIAPAHASTVTVYGAGWCPACESARAYLTRRGVPFVWRNVEQDPSARGEAAERARSIGADPNSIPLLDVGGTVISGFSATTVDEALRQRGLIAASSPPPEAVEASATFFLRGVCDHECRRLQEALRTRGVRVTECVPRLDPDAEADLRRRALETGVDVATPNLPLVYLRGPDGGSTMVGFARLKMVLAAP